MFDLDRAISLAKQKRAICEEISAEAKKGGGFLGIGDPESGCAIHVAPNVFHEIFEGEFDKKEPFTYMPGWWKFYAEADGVTFFCLNDSEKLEEGIFNA